MKFWRLAAARPAWFETRGDAALLTMRIGHLRLSDLILRRRFSAVSKDEAAELDMPYAASGTVHAL